MSKKPSKPNAYKDACAELHSGPFSILSERALGRIITLFDAIARESFVAGTEAVRKAYDRSHTQAER